MCAPTAPSPSPSLRIWSVGEKGLWTPGQRRPCPSHDPARHRGGRKPTTGGCALRRSGVKSSPCECGDPSASFPVPPSSPLPIASSGPKATAVLPTAARAVAAAAASAAENRLTCTSLCTSHHLIITTRAYLNHCCIRVLSHSIHCPFVQEEQCPAPTVKGAGDAIAAATSCRKHLSSRDLPRHHCRAALVRRQERMMCHARYTLQ